MSEMEQQELIDRINGMSIEEKQLAVTAIPSEILLDEICKRDKARRKMISDIMSIVEGGA